MTSIHQGLGLWSASPSMKRGEFATGIYQCNIALMTVGNHSCTLSSQKIIHNYINIFAKIAQKELAKMYVILFHINKSKDKNLCCDCV